MNNLKIKYLQFIATFMAVLVITIPIYSANVFAGLDSVSAEGSDGVDNYIKGEDYVNFKAIISASENETINQSQVWLGQNFVFDSCSEGINEYKCILRYPTNNTESWESKSQPYTINLKDNNSNIIDSKSGIFYVDDLAPKISSFSVESSSVSNGSIKFKYTIEEYACSDSSCNNKCSGIKKIELYKLNENYSQSNIIDSNYCSYSNESYIDSSSFGDGQHTIYAKAYDMLGQVSDAVSTILTVDNEAPEIDSSSFTITDDAGLEVNYASTEPFPVTVHIQITGDNLDKGNVIGNFTSIDSSYYNLKATCGDTSGSLTECTWSIDLSISNTTTTNEFVVEAKDSSGNAATAKVSKSFSLDATGPVVTSIKTDRVKDDKSYAKLKNNTFIAEIQEDVGLNSDQVILYLGSTGIKATNCSEGWTCYWYNADLSGSGDIQASIKEDTTDRLGNKAEPFTADITVDATSPKLVNISIDNIGGTEAAMEDYWKTGDSLQIIAIIEEDAIETAYADLSSIITNAENVVADSCTDIGNDQWQCSWITASIDISGYIENYIYLSFEDVAGNVLKHQEAITIYGLTGEAEPNYWTHTVECSPDLIDRQTTSLISQKVFCHVKLEALQEDVMTLSIDLEESGDSTTASDSTTNGNSTTASNNTTASDSTTAVQEAELFNNDAGSTNIYIKLTLEKKNFNVDDVNLTYQLDITSKVGNKITSPAEKEDVEIKLEFYNLPLGELSDSIKNKIDDAVEDATKTYWKLITGLKKIFFFAERICNFINILHNIVVVLKTVGRYLANLEVTTSGTPAGPGVKASRTLYDFYTEESRVDTLGVYNDLNKLCNAVNCKVGRAIAGEKEKGLDKWSRRLGGGWGIATMDSWLGSSTLKKWTGKEPFGPNGYMNVKDSMVLSVLTVCLPGIIYNLDKWRQIQCMYAHCLQEGVKQQGLPVMACEDQKSYAECKYITGEIFKVIPYTALFDFYIGKIKGVLSDPLGVVEVVLGYVCAPEIPGRTFAYDWCATPKIISMIGETIQDVTDIIDEGVFKIRDDYCKKLEE